MLACFVIFLSALQILDLLPGLDKSALSGKVSRMEPNWATEHLQVIRTLMERSAIYRRALAPVMTSTGILGIAAALAGALAGFGSPASFAIYWLLVGVGAVASAFILVRKQALKDREPFWSPPTRRVTQALLPPLAAGLMVSLIIILEGRAASAGFSDPNEITRLPAIWVILYGCALHAAGFFMPRGMKMFGWAFVLGGCALLALGFGTNQLQVYGHSVMGFFFGVLHLAYGIYLYFTEPRKNAL